MPEEINLGEFREKMGYKEERPKIEIVLPKIGKLISTFAGEVAEVLKDKGELFYRPDLKEIIEIGKVKAKDNGTESFTGFIFIKPNRFITYLERHIQPKIELWNDTLKTYVCKDKSITSELAGTILASEIMQSSLPEIKRIFTIPIPLMYNGELVFPKKGFDERFNSWLPYDAPVINSPRMEINEAKKMIESILAEFCFESPADKVGAIAALITPFIRGFYSRPTIRTPLFIFMANRERAGKDYLAGIIGLIYEGYSLEEPPISSGENNKTNNTDELRKKVIAAMMQGRKRLHFSNNKGYINNAVLESILTAERYSDRILGRNEIVTFDNELEFSLSGNVGIGFTADLANRSRFIRLFLDIENANARKFENPNLHGWIKENRRMILSALFSLIKNWVDKGMPEGNERFASYPEWARICGGIMEAAGYENPCKPGTDAMVLGGDTETQDMKEFFEAIYQEHKDEWLDKSKIKDFVSKEGLLRYIDFSDKSDQIKFGNKLIKFAGRVLSDIRLIVKDKSVRPARWEFMFTKRREVDKSLGNFGNGGNLGNGLPTLISLGDKKDIYIGNTLPTLPTLPNSKPKISFSDEELKIAGYDDYQIEEIKEELNRINHDKI